MHFIYQTNYPNAHLLCGSSINLIEFDEPVTDDFNNVTCSKCLSFGAEKYIVVIDRHSYLIEFDGNFYMNTERKNAYLFDLSTAVTVVKELRKDHKDVLVYKVVYEPVEITSS